jgi:cyclophilin family peptidyl-prolyl cis-trans isomerase
MNTTRAWWCLPVLALGLLLSGCGGSEESSGGGAPPTGAEKTSVGTDSAPGDKSAADKMDAKSEEKAGDKSASASAGGPVKLVMETSKGTIKLELYPDKAPLTVKNFLAYVKRGHYDGTIFHRVISTFMIQGGGFDKAMTEKATEPPIANEASNGLKNDRGTIAMARTSDPDSATAQFFINVVDNAPLNKDMEPSGAGYAVFGKVTGGMEVVDAIKDVPTGNKNGMDDVPNEPVVITSVKIEE